MDERYLTIVQSRRHEHDPQDYDINGKGLVSDELLPGLFSNWGIAPHLDNFVTTESQSTQS